MMPESTLDAAPPSGIIDTAHENSFLVITKLWLELRIFGPVGADQPKEMP